MKTLIGTFPLPSPLVSRLTSLFGEPSYRKLRGGVWRDRWQPLLNESLRIA